MRRIVSALFLIIVFGPVAALVLQSVIHLFSPDGTEVFRDAAPNARQLGLLWRTIVFSLCVCIGTTLLGISVGSVLWQWRSGIASWAKWVVLVLIIVPPYIHAMAWISTFSELNSLLANSGLAFPLLKGWPGAAWVEIMAYTPIAVGLSLIGFSSVDPALLDAARMSRSGLPVFLRIALPLAAPQILAASGLVFVLSITDYSLPQLFQLNVYPLEIFVYFASGGPITGALLLALPMLAITGVIIWLTQDGLRKAVMKPVWGTKSVSPQINLPSWVRNIQWTTMVIMAMQILVPLIVLSITAGSWNNLVVSVKNASDEISSTLLICITAGLLSLPLAGAVAWTIVRGRRRSVWWLCAILPIAIPAPLIGIGLIAMWNHPGLDALYGTLAMPVLASLARFAPFAVLLMLAQIRMLDTLLIDAARVFGGNRPWHRARVILPMLAPGLIGSACIVAALTAGELGATLIIAPPGQATLTMKIYNYMHYGAWENVAGLCLMMILLTFAAGIITVTGFRIWGRFHKDAGEYAQ